jgi:asparagine synthase (glutamine-hydrolysing)
MFEAVARQVRALNLTYLGDERLASINACLKAIKAGGVPGDFLEFGLALGGSGVCIASELDEGRAFVGLDVFGMIPPPGEADGAAPGQRYAVIRSGQSTGIGGETYYGYRDNLQDVVRANFERFGLAVDGQRIRFVPGLYQDTLPTLPEAKIAFAHVDCDWHEPVALCLAHVAPRLSVGGYVVVDDYNDWPGCRRATDEFLAAHPGWTMITGAPHAVLTRAAA